MPINILTLILSSTTVKKVEGQISLETEGALKQYMSQIDGAMERTSVQLHYMAIENVNFGRLNTKAVTTEEEYYKQLQATVSLKNDMNTLRTNNTWITGLFVLFPDKEINIIENDYPIYRNELLAYVEGVIETSELSKLSTWSVVDLDNTHILLTISYYKNAYYGAWIDLERLAHTLEIDQTEEGVIQLFTDDTGHICYANTQMPEEIDLNQAVWKHNGVGYVLVNAQSGYSDLCMVQIVSKSNITKTLPHMIRLLQVASLVALCIIPIIILSMKKWMLTPLHKLSSAMEKIEQGDMEFRITEEKSGSEFEQINRSFNHMMDQVSSLKIDVYEEQLEKQQIKMQFLSQQIQPHFILNAMNLLYSYEQDEYPLIQKMNLCLSKYFRYIVNANSDFVELREEMDHIRNYFEIQQARYPKTFFAMVEYEEDIGNCLVPPLLIQNFAENAIKHSIQIGNQIDIIVIAQKLEENFIRVRLSDTGEGISDDVLEKIEIFSKTREYQEGLGVGIQNSIERIMILYDGKTKLNISKEHPHGTRVELVLPLYRAEGREVHI